VPELAALTDWAFELIAHHAPRLYGITLLVVAVMGGHRSILELSPGRTIVIAAGI
jgi:hypothetical protein